MIVPRLLGRLGEDGELGVGHLTHRAFARGRPGLPSNVGRFFLAIRVEFGDEQLPVAALPESGVAFVRLKRDEQRGVHGNRKWGDAEIGSWMGSAPALGLVFPALA
jgi:hypothetical protein